jgi:hypothetical protein
MSESVVALLALALALDELGNDCDEPTHINLVVHPTTGNAHYERVSWYSRLGGGGGSTGILRT